eukprot:TRINITY_DN7032_c0_g1_i1.p1 TRINITY_DN7032_c0_g1~~TRINITY_DN7032_c0_g1_i1.p1  ORF type:complete len:513 (-),score=232.72 TRINITY_DN7032_c0_g1_i1:188-1726(-)
MKCAAFLAFACLQLVRAQTGSFVGFTDDEFVVIKNSKTLLRINSQTGETFFAGDVNAPSDVFVQDHSISQHLGHAIGSEGDAELPAPPVGSLPGMPPFSQPQAPKAPRSSRGSGVAVEEFNELKKQIDTQVSQISENLNRLYEQDKQIAEQLQNVINVRRQFQYVTPFQAVGTSGALAWKAFRIGEDHYLALAQYQNETSGYSVESMIFKWDGSGFQLYQRIATVGARDIEYASVGDDHFLIVANSYDGTNFAVDSVVFKFNPTDAKFEEFQRIPTQDAFDAEFFKIGEQSYLAIANHFNGKSYQISSKIYKWDGAGFREHQALSTNGASSFAAFSIGDKHFLAVAHAFDGSSCQTDSKIMKFNGDKFEVVQSLPTSCAFDFEYFTIDGAHYLAVANCNNGTSYLVNSKLYRFDGDKFNEHQLIPTSGAFHWESFKIGVENFLVVANCNDGNSTAVVSNVYKWQGVSFVEAQSNLLTVSAMAFEYFEIGSNAFLAAAFQNHPLSPVYYVKTN